jgi:flagellar biosynthesis protein FlhB
MTVPVCRSCGRELTEQDLSGSTERGLCLDCSQELAQREPQERQPTEEPRQSTRRRERPTRKRLEDTEEVGEIVYASHHGARTIAWWLGGIAWFILIVGLLASLVLAIAIGTTCEESLVNDCDNETASAWIIGIAGSVQSVIGAVVFFAARHAVLLLVEIAERE